MARVLARSACECARRVQGRLLCLAAPSAVRPCCWRRSLAETRPDRACQLAPDLWGAARPCRSAGTRRTARAQADRAPDARCRAGRRLPSARRTHHDPAGQGGPARARSGGPQPHGVGAEPAMDRRHHLSANCDGLPLSGRGARCLEPQGRRLVHGEPPASRIGAGRARDGHRPAAAQGRRSS